MMFYAFVLSNLWVCFAYKLIRLATLSRFKPCPNKTGVKLEIMLCCVIAMIWISCEMQFILWSAVALNIRIDCHSTHSMDGPSWCHFYILLTFNFQLFSSVENCWLHICVQLRNFPSELLSKHEAMTAIFKLGPFNILRNEVERATCNLYDSRFWNTKWAPIKETDDWGNSRSYQLSNFPIHP